jgi:DNA-binding LytR/AlgR family response regulator
MNTIDPKQAIKKNSYFDLTKITYFKADVNYTQLYFVGGKTKTMPYTIKRFEEYLAMNQNFIRIHRAYIINRNYINELSVDEVTLSCGVRLPVARRRRFFAGL